MPLNTVEEPSIPQRLHPVGNSRFLAVAALCFLAFGLCLQGDFYMDDYLHIVEEEAVIDGTWHDKNFRVLPYLLWTATHRLFGFEPLVFHVWNLLVHTLTACLLIPTARRFLTAGAWLKDDASRLRVATAAALLFAVHPLCSEPVNYARCLMIGLVNLFTVLSVWGASLTLSSWGKPCIKYAAFTFLALVGATLSKSPGVFHAGAAIAVTWLALGRFRPLVSWVRRDTDALAAAAATTVAFGKLWPFIEYWAGMAAWQFRSPDFLAHLLTQGRVFWAYLLRFVWPAGLSSDHRIQQSLSFSDTPAAVGFILALALGVSIAVCIFVRRTRLVASLAALGLVHLYLRFLFNNNEFMVEYRTYPVLPWLCVLVALAWLPLHRYRRKLALYGFSALVLGSVTASALRSAVWSDSGALARDTLERYPANNRARGILMLNHYRAGDYASVHAVHQEICAVTDAVEKSNTVSRSAEARVYEPSRLYLDQAAADRMLALALVELKGVDYAIKFTEFAIDRIIGKRQTAGGITAKKRIEEDLADLREVLIEKGAEYEAQKNPGS